MIVDEEKVQTALDYLSIWPHPEAKAKWRLSNAENEFEVVWAQVYKENEGTVEDRKCACHLDQRVRDAKEAVSKGRYEADAHKARVRSSETIIDVWRSENANARAMERIR
jgi:hypothetical protein